MLECLLEGLDRLGVNLAGGLDPDAVRSLEVEAPGGTFLSLTRDMGLTREEAMGRVGENLRAMGRAVGERVMATLLD